MRVSGVGDSVIVEGVTVVLVGLFIIILIDTSSLHLSPPHVHLFRLLFLIDNFKSSPGIFANSKSITGFTLLVCCPLWALRILKTTLCRLHSNIDNIIADLKSNDNAIVVDLKSSNEEIVVKRNLSPSHRI
ncbi:hypothetical protein BDZ89DRAFT_1049364 [Hymenopellis radicata]|nr:hypothetical protein BDZ89DRAFT_1049364 [Hymenopellis radicata]